MKSGVESVKKGINLAQVEKSGVIYVPGSAIEREVARLDAGGQQRDIAPFGQKTSDRMSKLRNR